MWFEQKFYILDSMSSYLPLPPELKRCYSLLNIKNTDQKSFAYSVLAGLYPQKKLKRHAASYKKLLPRINMNGERYC
jgi:hypothetical protein